MIDELIFILKHSPFPLQITTWCEKVSWTSLVKIRKISHPDGPLASHQISRTGRVVNDLNIILKVIALELWEICGGFELYRKWSNNQKLHEGLNRRAVLSPKLTTPDLNYLAADEKLINLKPIMKGTFIVLLRFMNLRYIPLLTIYQVFGQCNLFPSVKVVNIWTKKKGSKNYLNQKRNNGW